MEVQVARADTAAAVTDDDDDARPFQVQPYRNQRQTRQQQQQQGHHPQSSPPQPASTPPSHQPLGMTTARPPQDVRYHDPSFRQQQQQQPQRQGQRPQTQSGSNQGAAAHPSTAHGTMDRPQIGSGPPRQQQPRRNMEASWRDASSRSQQGPGTEGSSPRWQSPRQDNRARDRPTADTRKPHPDRRQERLPPRVGHATDPAVLDAANDLADPPSAPRQIDGAAPPGRPAQEPRAQSSAKSPAPPKLNHDGVVTAAAAAAIASGNDSGAATEPRQPHAIGPSSAPTVTQPAPPSTVAAGPSPTSPAATQPSPTSTAATVGASASATSERQLPVAAGAVASTSTIASVPTSAATTPLPASPAPAWGSVAKAAPSGPAARPAPAAAAEATPRPPHPIRQADAVGPSTASPLDSTPLAAAAASVRPVVRPSAPSTVPAATMGGGSETTAPVTPAVAMPAVGNPAAARPVHNPGPTPRPALAAPVAPEVMWSSAPGSSARPVGGSARPVLARPAVASPVVMPPAPAGPSPRPVALPVLPPSPPAEAAVIMPAMPATMAVGRPVRPAVLEATTLPAVIFMTPLHLEQPARGDTPPAPQQPETAAVSAVELHPPGVIMPPMPAPAPAPAPASAPVPAPSSPVVPAPPTAQPTATPDPTAQPPPPAPSSVSAAQPPPLPGAAPVAASAAVAASVSATQPPPPSAPVSSLPATAAWGRPRPATAMATAAIPTALPTASPGASASGAALSAASPANPPPVAPAATAPGGAREARTAREARSPSTAAAPSTSRPATAHTAKHALPSSPPPPAAGNSEAVRTPRSGPARTPSASKRTTSATPPSAPSAASPTTTAPAALSAAVAQATPPSPSPASPDKQPNLAQEFRTLIRNNRKVPEPERLSRSELLKQSGIPESFPEPTDPTFTEVWGRFEHFNQAEQAIDDELEAEAKAARAKQTTTSAPGAKSSPAGRPAKASAPAPAYQDEWTQQFVHDRVIPALPPASIVDRIAKFKVVMTRPMVRPRGLDNLGNMCYMNAMLHPLLYCGPFYNLLAQFQAAELRAVGLAPLLLAMVEFAEEFQPLKSSSVDEWRKQPPLRRFGAPFSPENIYNALRRVETHGMVAGGRQQDAEEFLGFFLDMMHEELVHTREGIVRNRAVVKEAPRRQSLTSIATPEQLAEVAALEASTVSKKATAANEDDKPEEEDDQWLEIGRKRKAVAARRRMGPALHPAMQTKSDLSPIVAIFQGRQRSELKPQSLASLVNSQACLLFNLEIAADRVRTLVDAFNLWATPESVEYAHPETKEPVETFKTMRLEELPPVLILLLGRGLYGMGARAVRRRFSVVYGSEGARKLHKFIEYPLQLSISPRWMHPPNNKSAPLYKLTSVVYHHGQQVGGGHYTCDVLHPCGSWIRVNDEAVSEVSGRDVISEKADRVAYVLFYERAP